MNRSGRSWAGLVLVWIIGSTVVGAAIGWAVGFFGSGSVERPLLLMSILFANVVGLTAFFSATVLFPRLSAMNRVLRFALLICMLIAGAGFGSLTVLYLFPFFVARDVQQTVAIVALNELLCVTIGIITFGYETMRQRLEETLTEVREVRLAEAQLREAAARAELTALQAQINPHFFFNTLNTIASLVDEDREQAEEVLHRLAGLFRYTFKSAGAEPVALREELEFIRNYLEVEKARFGDRLTVAWDIDPASNDVPVPGLLLQPLVENAVAHGISPQVGGGTVTIFSRLVERTLHLEVTDDGVGVQNDGATLIHDDHGLGNVRRRLRALYGGDGSLSLHPRSQGNGTVARLLVPVRPRREDA